jgi:ABC-2 type transport system ATP-binding protein
MLQRVGIAQAVLHEPEVVFLDEPMSGLDPVGRREIREFIQALNQEGKTIFFSTHILADAQALCHRVSVLNRGELRGVGVVAELLGKARKQFDVIWEGASAIPRLEAMGIRCHAAGDTIRATVEEAKLQDVLNILRVPNARLVSVNPVGGSLEEFFLERVAQTAEVRR